MRLAPPTPCGSAGETSHLPSLLHTGTGTLAHHYCSPLLPLLSLSPYHCHSLHLRVSNVILSEMVILRERAECTRTLSPAIRLYHTIQLSLQTATCVQQEVFISTIYWHSVLSKHYLRSNYFQRSMQEFRVSGFCTAFAGQLRCAVCIPFSFFTNYYTL